MSTEEKLTRNENAHLEKREKIIRQINEIREEVKQNELEKAVALKLFTFKMGVKKRAASRKLKNHPQSLTQANLSILNEEKEGIVEIIQKFILKGESVDKKAKDLDEIYPEFTGQITGKKVASIEEV